MEPGSGAGTVAGAWSGPDPAGRRRRRWRTLAAGLAAVLLVAGMAAVADRLAWRAADWPLEGRIRVGASWRRSLRFALGDFRVDWDGRTGSLAVWNGRMPGHLVWATPPGQAFFFGAAGTMRSRDTIGYLTLWRRTLSVYGEQTVDGIAAGSGQLRFTGELRSVDGSAVRYTFTLRAAAPDRLEYEGRVGPAAAGAPPVTRLYLDWKALPGERFYGFGVQYSALDMRGRVVPILVQEHGIGRGMQPLTLLADLTHGAGGSWWNTYAPVPYFLSSAMQSMFSANGQFQRFNLTEPGLGQLEVEAPAIRGAIFAGRTPAELLRAYTAVAGRMRPLPAWTQEGFLFGAEGGTAAVRARLERLLAAGVPVTGLWLQDWVGQRTTSFGQQLVWNWRLDARQYPGWAAFVRELRAKGIRVLGYVNPFLVPAGGSGLYREAAARGYFVRGADGRPLLFPYPGFRAALIDLTNPAARAWLERVMVRELVGNGFSGWMADFGEELPLDARLADGRTGATLHNLYPVLWAQLNRQVLERAGLAG
ncbi:MAG: hypothetical protein IRZ26_09435, partial [Clostridia bacterium]|nr:hypothetical protein [Clostridia bacterium]